MALAIRLLTPADLPGAMRLKEAAGWNQTERDWRNVMHLAPEGAFAIECDGAVRATATAVSYGTRLGWIGMVLTDPGYRGRGLARALMEHAIEYLRTRGVAWIKLDATDMGHSLYSKLGFEDECAIERWAGSAGQVLPPAGSGAASADLDLRAFGADRSALLRLLAEQDCSLGRPGSKAAYFGPCVAASAEDARACLLRFLAAHPGERVFWDILETNQAAVTLAREFGFAPVRRLVRMARRGAAGGAAFTHDDSLVFAAAGFEYG